MSEAGPSSIFLDMKLDVHFFWTPAFLISKSRGLLGIKLKLFLRKLKVEP